MKNKGIIIAGGVALVGAALWYFTRNKTVEQVETTETTSEVEEPASQLTTPIKNLTTPSISNTGIVTPKVSVQPTMPFRRPGIFNTAYSLRTRTAPALQLSGFLLS